ncbi:MAG: hypothetical protein N2110_00490 [Flavobacteriales bacterium]|nr:hypothetical protein [Flavobacteriales bacterium]MCX7767488.1 hypothetical protein [Flavobacteriales bacterium]MDW8409624.1 regulatory iron-sulfur-containing complex subunit RicT [Flavobacteriales bacterium]
MGCATCDARLQYGRAASAPAGCGNRGLCVTGGCNKLNTYDWLSPLHRETERQPFPWVEVRFKNTRKEFFYCPPELRVRQGDVVCTQGTPGVDVGVVELVGPLVKIQMKKVGFDYEKESSPRRVLRLARQSDIDRWQKAIAREKEALPVVRQQAASHGLDIKVTDVEFQGDGTKILVYYLADERVDFRKLVKNLAHTLGVRVEMRQLGARQEAGLVGGLGSCGRELCCATWLRDFRTVNTSAARYQFLSINSQKLAGQCGKLKCCLNYELDMYLEAFEQLPSYKEPLEFVQGKAEAVKVDIFKKLYTYECCWEPGLFFTLEAEKVEEILRANKEGHKPEAPVAIAKTYIQKIIGQDEDSSDTEELEWVSGQAHLLDKATGLEGLERKGKNKQKKKRKKTQRKNGEEEKEH